VRPEHPVAISDAPARQPANRRDATERMFAIVPAGRLPGRLRP
jgi:hypothetical protein